MEQFEDTYKTPEQLDDIRIYKGLLEHVLLARGVADEALDRLRQRFTLDDRGLNDIAGLRLDVATVQAVKDELDAKALELTNEAVGDITRDIFEPKLFSVAAIYEGRARLVEGIMAEGETIHPIIDGEPYRGPIEHLVFDI